MPLDNDVYDRLGGSWWDEDNPLNMLHGSITPGRFAYFRQVLMRQHDGQVRGLRALDIGCGGGFLAEQFAALGCRVTGVDPSAVSIEAARSHPAARGLDIDYRVRTGEQLPARTAPSTSRTAVTCWSTCATWTVWSARQRGCSGPGACTCSTPSTAP